MKTQINRLATKQEAILMKAIEIRNLISELRKEGEDSFYLDECDESADEITCNIICSQYPDPDDYDRIARLYGLDCINENATK